MKKKHGLIFLCLGILLLGIFCFVYYKKSSDNTPTSDPVEVDDNNYNFVKSRDVEDMTKISFPVNDDLTLEEYYSDDFYKYYKNSDGLSLMVGVNQIDISIDEYTKNEESVKEAYEKQGKKVSEKRVECDYLCRKREVSNSDGSIYFDEFKVYYFVSENEVFELIYQQLNKKLSDELIDSVKKNIKITYDATYTTSKIFDNKLIVELQMPKKKTLLINLDSNIYEEVISGANSNRMTILRNKSDNSEFRLFVQYKRDKVTLQDEIDEYFNHQTKNEIVVGNYKGYEYNINNLRAYALIIDEETVLLINVKKGLININDFSNITINGI